MRLYRGHARIHNSRSTGTCNYQVACTYLPDTLMKVLQYTSSATYY